ncbi:oxysterol-binding protein 1A, putative [Ixodes scapularis]|uniref:Oxysterol-binding protein n=1 Tax=Ixodes scapularis TaxID=6945 RepID=B7P7L6_IXOSC|nr:oxysterol-binding protein 1A, putative [Ixodes scapularis]|eukprot:XP_002399281.1 oxysterol-binding protein 1A, putative [Ixodes scapularis]
MNIVSDDEDNTKPSDLPPEELLLQAARSGAYTTVKGLLNGSCHASNGAALNVDCKGKQKANLGWTPLHLASYFGHFDVAEILLEHGAYVDVVNREGDTPLHKAAYTGREGLVMLLLKYNADVFIINCEGQSPKQVAENTDIKNILAAAESADEKKKADQFFAAVKEGNVDAVQNLLRARKPPNINCKDGFGNTALHSAAYRDRKQIAVLLLQCGIDSTLRNARGQLAADLAHTDEMRQILHVAPIRQLRKNASRHEGPLLRCDPTDEAGFVVLFPDDPPERLTVPPDDNDRVDRMTAQAQQQLLERGVDRATAMHADLVQVLDAHQLSCVGPCQDLLSQWKELLLLSRAVSSSLGSCTLLLKQQEETAQAQQQLLERGVDRATAMHADLVQVLDAHQLSCVGPCQDLLSQWKELLLLSRAVSSSLGSCTLLLKQQEEARSARLDQERERSRVLQESLSVLAREHHHLECTLSNTGVEEEAPLHSDDEFFDAFEGEASPARESQSSAELTNEDEVEDEMYSSLVGPEELSKITMPVVFNEPLSFLQRISENMEYSHLLVQADQASDPVDRMELVTAFAVSALASNLERLSKPFNPLLGETYELIREEVGFRMVCEQVSHHPPVSAFHAESPHFKVHGSVYPKLKFWGKSIEIKPEGHLCVTLLSHGEEYTWANVNCCIHNIIVGKLWFEQYGLMEITCRKTHLTSALTFKQAGWFFKDLHRIEGFSPEPCELDEGEIPKSDSTYSLDIPNSRLLWQATPRPDYSPEANGAAAEKNRLEEKQREARKQRKKHKDGWEPRWFKLGKGAYSSADEWQFTGAYWDRDFSNSPDIF